MIVPRRPDVHEVSEAASCFALCMASLPGFAGAERTATGVLSVV